jgi:hypothetical protein
MKRDIKLSENCDKLHSLIFGQCTDFMREKLASIEGYETMKCSLHDAALIKAIKGLTYKFEGRAITRRPFTDQKSDCTPFPRRKT